MDANATARPSERPRRSRAKLTVLPDPELSAQLAARGEARARAQLAAAAAAGEPLLTPTGRARSLVTMPDYRRGRAPANKGRRYPAEVLTPDEIGALLEVLPSGPAGIRTRAMIVLLWRSGLRVGEALALRPCDVDLEAGTITVLHGKGDRRRVVGIDQRASEYLREWLRVRRTLSVHADAPLFCTVMRDHAGVGRALGSSSLRGQLKRYARKAGISKRVHPHGFRHTHASELANESIPVDIIRRQLGHNSLSMTANYIDHLAPAQVVRAIAEREWPGDGGAPPALTRATASQAAPAPRRDPTIVPAYNPAPPEPAERQYARPGGLAGPRGEAKAKLLEVLRRNGGRATGAQLGRALGIKDAAVRKHLHELEVDARIERIGEIPRAGRPLVVWGLPPLAAVYRVDGGVELAAHARRGMGAQRVLEAIRRAGGRASRAQLAGELGVNSETVGVHCRALESTGQLARGGLDKARSNRGSQLWRLPSGERYGTPPGLRLELCARASSSSTAGRPGRAAGGCAPRAAL
jgi:integrase/recombinase XerD